MKSTTLAALLLATALTASSGMAQMNTEFSGSNNGPLGPMGAPGQFSGQMSQGGPPGGGPPPEAFSACADRQQGAACQVTTPHGKLDGQCRPDRFGGAGLVCVPNSHRGGPPGMNSGGQPGAAPNMANGFSRPPGNFARGQSRRPQGGGAPGGRPQGYTPRAADPNAIATHNRLPDSGQITCFDARRVIDCPKPGEPFFGQDGNYAGRAMAYESAGAGAVRDLATGLTWESAHHAQRLHYPQAQQRCAQLSLAGRDDWRLPTIRELFSISHWAGYTGGRPFLDSSAFEIKPPSWRELANDPYATHSPEMMGQTWSATAYPGRVMNRGGHNFFFNFLDGRIKSAPRNGPVALFSRCVSGPVWGENDFVAHKDGVVTDRAFGLMWQQKDDGHTRNWGDALAYCENLTLASHNDWRLPNVRELQSLVDYSRANLALDTQFFTQRDPSGWFWSSTTHGDSPSEATYLCFGQCVSTQGIDVHGAGAQRSDPKSGDPTRWSSGRGGQQDAVRIVNYARCVRDAN
ncbi:DUF1566 domain-containing protein [Magnetofaba australis]|uniref:Lcl C-terminal domain-containing protein n=1 Tax=Magnetofaba australis IT-1 TaxID=1434232 RepID=A0A1Y2K7L3_9PROT|nr:DUF1566 domain-containing protein [Magnetofaba australis]OSM05348.1 hypothetical protein MAIT1_03526 [Magnetofaba australis IT-1]